MSNKGTKHWPGYADNKLRAMYFNYPQADLMKTFPTRTWISIGQRARKLGLKRARKFIKASQPAKGPLMDELRTLRERRNLPARRLGKMIGVTQTYIARCERGIGSPGVHILVRWAAALGHELTVRPVRDMHV